MKILIVGGGGREHAIAWKLSQSSLMPELFCAPGNGGISEIATLVPIEATDIDGICAFAKEKSVDLVVVAPDDPLVAGMVDALEKEGIRAFGPSAKAAQIEGSKVFSKDLMKKYGIPTAEYETFSDADEAIAYLEGCSYPIVIKAEGLALGKGVIIPQTFEEAKQGVLGIMQDKQFGEAGNRIVIEEFLTGREISVLAFTDSHTLLPMCSAQDHKRALDNDEGLNTGGMGAYSPSPIYTPALEKECMEKIFIPTIEAMNKEGRPFKGVLYFGLMSTNKGVRVIEYNARFGDPETQVVLPRLENDLLEIMEAIIDERLGEIKLSFRKDAAACIIAASGGYPQSYQKGYPISGLENTENAIVFHSGTIKKEDVFVTNGGRVLGVTALGETLRDAVDLAYKNINKITFKDMHYRRDIGKHGVV